jgi:DUF4097 and DUF4098 domain-containing protein YvlB
MIAATLLAVLLAANGGDVTAQQNLNFSVQPAPTIRIDTTNGSINLKTAGTRVAVIATKSADSQSKIDNLKVTSTQTGNIVTIHAIIPNPCNDCGSISFEATVPPNAKIELITTNGSITATGISGNASLNSSNGSITGTYANASGVKTIAAETTNGSVTLTLPSGAKLGRVQLSTNVGHISSSWPITINKSNFVGATADQTLTAGGTNINLTTTNGSISITRT